MGITRVGSNTGTNTATMPTHQAGDLIICFAYRDGSNTVPTIPGGLNWATAGSSGGNSNSSVVVYKTAANASETVGTFTNATGLIVHVYRNASYIRINGGGAQSTTITWPTIGGGTSGTPYSVPGNRWLIWFAGHRSVNTSIDTAYPVSDTQTPRVNTFLDATNEVASFDFNQDYTSFNWYDIAVSVGGTSSGWRAWTIEIEDATPPSSAVTKSVNGVLNASVKDVNGVLNAAAKKWNTIDF